MSREVSDGSWGFGDGLAARSLPKTKTPTARVEVCLRAALELKAEHRVHAVGFRAAD
jgi:hypothetical protein